MKFKVSPNVYSEEMSEKAFSRTLRRIALKRPVAGLFVVTEPIMNTGIMEIYDYNELLQPYYRKNKSTLNILGIAKSRESAKILVCDIIDDAYRELGGPKIKELFGLSG